MKTAFAIVHTWPDLKNAEYEVLKRILKAAERIEADVLLIDNMARVIWASPGTKVAVGKIAPAESVEFLLSLHFESPRLLDVYSYITLWQPIEFYHGFGYQVSIDKMCSHNDLISCNSDIADAHGLNLLRGLGRPPIQPLPRMYHMLPEPFLVPDVTETSKLFYIGINWERVGKPTGRFHETLIALDDAGLVDIYGPRLILGVAPWEGFDSYKGEIPFDGESVKHAIHRSGICLALSSMAHKNAGIMSNRLFEGLAGGAAVIASPNALIDKLFADVVYLVDDARGDEVLSEQIIEAVHRIRADPAEAMRRTLEGQRILREQCSLERSLQTLFEQTPARRLEHRRQFLASARLTVILTYRSKSADDLVRQIAQLSRQSLVTIDLRIVCDPSLRGACEALAVGGADDAIASLEVHGVDFDPQPASFDGVLSRPQRSGPAVLNILRSVRTDYFAFLELTDDVFSEHFASLVRAFEQNPAARFACSGALVERGELGQAPARALKDARFVEFNSITLVTGVGQAGRFLYRSALLETAMDELMLLLDGEEHSYFRLLASLEGPLAQTGYSSYVLNETRVGQQIPPVEPFEHQRQYIRDRFSRDPRWLDRLSKGDDLPRFVYAYNPGTAVQWRDQTTPFSVLRRMRPDHRYHTCIGGDGARFLDDGFSDNETESTWVAAERGVLHLALSPDDNFEIGEFVLLLDIAGRPSLASGRTQHCTFAVNGMVISYQRIPEQRGIIALALPRQATNAQNMLRIEIIPDYKEQVFDAAGAIIDSRPLSVRLYGFELRSREWTDAPLLEPGERHMFVEGSSAAPALAFGFYTPEDEFTWVAGTSGLVKFRLAEPERPTAFSIKVAGRRSIASGALPTLRITLNGADQGRHVVEETPGIITLEPDPALLASGLVTMRLDVSHAEAVYDDQHNIVDPRLLGMSLHEIELLDPEDADAADAESDKAEAVAAPGTKGGGFGRFPSNAAPPDRDDPQDEGEPYGSGSDEVRR